MQRLYGSLGNAVHTLLCDIEMSDHVSEENLRAAKERLRRAPRSPGVKNSAQFIQRVSRYQEMKAEVDNLPDTVDAAGADLMDRVEKENDWFLAQADEFRSLGQRITR